MSINRRKFLHNLALLSATGTTGILPQWACAAQIGTKKLRLGITLEPPGLDPTVSASSSISEVCLYNIYETLTKITPQGEVEPLLAKSWEVSNKADVYTFYLEKGVKFHNGEAFNAQTVQFTLQEAGAVGSTNKDKAFYTNIKTISVINEHTIQIALINPDADFLFKLAFGTAIMREPKSAPHNRLNPIGTGPYAFSRWRKGISIDVFKWLEHRHAKTLQVEEASFLFISDSYAQMASLLSGDVDVFARVAVARSMPAFTRQPSRFQVLVSDSRAKTLLSINHRKAPLNDIRVRRAVTAAIDRNAIIESAADGYGVAIGSHYTPSMPGYVDTTNIAPYDPASARKLLQEAGVKTPLKLDFVLPPAPYARQGGEVIASLLAKVGIELKILHVEWAQWLSQVYTQHHYDLSMVSHVEPLDLENYTRKDYYWGYQSDEFDALYNKIQSTLPGEMRNKLLAQAQNMLAHDAVNVWLYQPRWATVADAKIQGLWEEMPIFVNDLSVLRWI